MFCLQLIWIFHLRVLETGLCSLTKSEDFVETYNFPHPINRNNGPGSSRATTWPSDKGTFSLSAANSLTYTYLGLKMNTKRSLRTSSVLVTVSEGIPEGSAQETISQLWLDGFHLRSILCPSNPSTTLMLILTLLTTAYFLRFTSVKVQPSIFSRPTRLFCPHISP